jgi:hypothetical protein
MNAEQGLESVTLSLRHRSSCPVLCSIAFRSFVFLNSFPPLEPDHFSSRDLKFFYSLVAKNQLTLMRTTCDSDGFNPPSEGKEMSGDRGRCDEALCWIQDPQSASALCLVSNISPYCGGSISRHSFTARVTYCLIELTTSAGNLHSRFKTSILVLNQQLPLVDRFPTAYSECSDHSGTKLTPAHSGVEPLVSKLLNHVLYDAQASMHVLHEGIDAWKRSVTRFR